MNAAELNNFSKIPNLITNNANASTQGCLMGVLNSDVKVAISTQNNMKDRLDNKLTKGDLILESYNKGLVIARITTTERDAPEFVPVEGMLIYNTNRKLLSII